MLNALSASHKPPPFKAKLRGLGAECKGAAARLHLTMETILTKLQLYSRAWCLFGVSILRIDRRRSATSKLLLPILRYRFTPMCRKTARQPASSLPSAGCLWKCLVGGNNHSTLKLARTSQFWRAVIFSMPGICPTLRLSSRTKANNCNLFWSGAGAFRSTERLTQQQMYSEWWMRGVEIRR